MLRNTPLIGVFLNLLVALLCYVACQAVFMTMNWSVVTGHFSWDAVSELLSLGILIAGCSVIATNSAYIVLAILPFNREKHKWFGLLLKWLFVSVNAVCIVANLCDTIFFHYTQRRVTIKIFKEFGGETNIANIAFQELMKSWWLLLVAAGLISLLILLYARCDYAGKHTCKGTKILNCFNVLLVYLGLIFFWHNLSNYKTETFLENRAEELDINHFRMPFVQNAPYLLISTAFEPALATPTSFSNNQKMRALYNPVFLPNDSLAFESKNIVIVIVEGLSKNLTGYSFDSSGNNSEATLTPFIDSLARTSVTFSTTVANGKASIDALPSILSSIPRLKQSFTMTEAVYHDLPSLPRELRKHGYASAFFHGAPNNTLGFKFYTQRVGVEKYYGMDEFYQTTGGNPEVCFDGTWAIWDEDFLAFTAREIDKLHQPFIATIFTASSHHPFNIPAKYEGRFRVKGESKSMGAVRYADYSLSRFFEYASNQSWYYNSIFVVCADHTSPYTRNRAEDCRSVITDIEIPILIFVPSDSSFVGVRDGVMQQIDIMPTLLSMLHHDEPFVAFGKDVFSSESLPWAFSWYGAPRYIEGNTVVSLGRGDKVGVDRIIPYSSQKGKSVRERMGEKKSFLRGRLYNGSKDSIQHKSIVDGSLISSQTDVAAVDSLEIILPQSLGAQVVLDSINFMRDRAMAILQTIIHRINTNTLSVVD